jgi:hypothetical protein
VKSGPTVPHSTCTVIAVLRRSTYQLSLHTCSIWSSPVSRASVHPSVPVRPSVRPSVPSFRLPSSPVRSRPLPSESVFSLPVFRLPVFPSHKSQLSTCLSDGPQPTHDCSVWASLCMMGGLFRLGVTSRCYMCVPRVGTCRALQGYDIRARGTDPRPNIPLPVG